MLSFTKGGRLGRKAGQKSKKRRFGRIGKNGWTYTDDVRKAVRFLITRVARRKSLDLDADIIPTLEHAYGYRIVRSFLLNCLTVPGKGFLLTFDGESVAVEPIGRPRSKPAPVMPQVSAEVADTALAGVVH